MIVYVETNFVLELAFLQEECEQAERIANLAESGEIQLVIPAFSGGEPYERMIRRSRDRKALHDRLAVEIKELSRSSPYTNIDDTSRELTAILSESASDEKARLDAVVLRLTNLSRMIPLDNDVLRISIGYQGQFALGIQDAIVFASVVSHLQSLDLTEEKLFVTKNRNDFLNPDISDVLSSHNCKLFFRFMQAIGYIESVLRQAG
ncbi:MAG TPA: PIN domain-containing protein [Blastocatellia bacterium]|nr:PIN domain-containing protein [Blastocatellia bacterium]